MIFSFFIFLLENCPKSPSLYLNNNGPFIIDSRPYATLELSFATVSKRVPVQKIPNENEHADEKRFSQEDGLALIHRN